MSTAAGSSPTRGPRRDLPTLALRILAALLLVPAMLLLLLAAVAFLTGDGVSDAAPWWLFLGLLGIVLGLPGLLLALLARWRARWARARGDLAPGGDSQR